MRASRGMGIISPAKNPKRKTVVKRDGPEPVSLFAKGGKVDHPSGGSRVNEAGVYTKPGMRKSLFESIKSRETQGTKAGQWSARKAQLLAKQYKARGGGYK